MSSVSVALWPPVPRGPSRACPQVQSQPSDYDDIDIITDYFNEGPRLRSRRLGSPDPPLAHWTRPELSVRWMEKLLWQEGPHRYDCISSWTLRETLAYAEGVRECTQFKPSLGLSVIKLLKGSRVLDFSSGWGDRLIAAIAADVERYVGVDPNADLRPGYEAIIARFAGRERAARYTMVRAPFQTARLPPGETFDLVFTSPPYFNFELYSSAADQSAVEVGPLCPLLLPRPSALAEKSANVGQSRTSHSSSRPVRPAKGTKGT